MSTYTYKSTRGQVSGWSFEQVVMGGLAPDGGLFIPENIPQIQTKINEWSNLDYKSLCYNIIRLYIDPKEVSDVDLQRLITASYRDNFRDQLIAPCRSVGPVLILELFHGPTYSFKDVALQFLGNLFEYFLTKPDGANQNQHITILGATSGGKYRISNIHVTSYWYWCRYWQCCNSRDARKKKYSSFHSISARQS